MSVDFLNLDYDKNARRKTLMLAGVFTLCVGLIAFTGAWVSYRSVSRGTTVFDELGHLPGITNVRQMVFGQDPPEVLGASDQEPDIMRILILGIGGAGHDGSLLTDTIILASVDLKNNRVGMLSIPRDLAFPRGDGTFEKINARHAWEEQAHPGEGAVRTAKEFSDFFGISIDHVVRIDFRGFASLIDAVGGVDVNVANSFTDTQYPTDDDLYQTISFRKGMQHMDGSTALIFTRSRHGNNGEGSDFARSARQQLVILALRQKLLTLNTLGDPSKLAKLYQAVTSHVQSDLTPWDAIRLAPMLGQFSPDKINMHVLTDAENGELVAANINNNFLLFPRGNDWTHIKQLAKDPFDDGANAVIPASKANIEVRNGTLRTGLAFQISNELNLDGYRAGNMGNATRRDYKQTTIYDLTNGQKSAELSTLRRLLNADVSLSSTSSTASGRIVYAENMSIEKIINPDTDFLVILGEDASTSLSDTTTPYATSSNP